MKRIILVLFLFVSLLSFAKKPWKPWPLPMDSLDTHLDVLRYNGEFIGIASSGKYSPFWISANTDGMISTNPYSIYLRAGIEKQAERSARWWDYSYGIDLVGSWDVQRWKTDISKFYAHVRLWCFDITAGIKPYLVGNQDYELSSGGFLFSRNAHAIPRITIGIDKYTAFPFTYGYLEVKGGITHGWFVDNVGTVSSLLHHKYIGVQLGGKLPVNINYEFHHAAQWGGVSPMYGSLGESFKDFCSVFKAHSGGVMPNDQINALGNHIGSQMLGIDVKFTGWRIKAYWQSIFEDGPIKPIWSTMNISDGLWGISIHQNRWPFINGLIYEYFATTDQSGPCHDIDGIIFGGGDDYFNNSIYRQGWTHFSRTIGNPFITSPIYNDNGSISILNNRTMSHYVAVGGDIYGVKYIARYSHSKNFGTYKLPYATYNNSAYLTVQYLVPKAWNLNFSVALGCDWGTQFGSSFGAMFTISRSGIIYKSKK